MTGGCVVVLGATGRNFAAGMSGGIAYVLDEDGSFESRCNMAMVELEPVTGDLDNKLAGFKDDMRTHDAERLYKLLENHARYTNSKRAQEILADWDTYRKKFLKVMPTEYRRALNELAESETAIQPAAGE